MGEVFKRPDGGYLIVTEDASGAKINFSVNEQMYQLLVKQGRIKPNGQPSPGPIANTTGVIVPKTLPWLSGGNGTLPKDETQTEEEAIDDEARKLLEELEARKPDRRPPGQGATYKAATSPLIDRLEELAYRQEQLGGVKAGTALGDYRQGVAGNVLGSLLGAMGARGAGRAAAQRAPAPPPATAKPTGGYVKKQPDKEKKDKPSDCCPKNSAPGKKPVASKRPVHFGTGEEVLRETDFVLDSAQPFAWTRCYRSGSEAEDWGLLGARWATPYTASLSVCKQGMVYHEDSGRALRLPLLVVGQTHDQKSEGFILRRDDDSRFTLTWRDGSTDTFTRGPDGWLPHGYDGVNAMLAPQAPVATERYYLTRSSESDGRYTVVERFHDAQPGDVLLRIQAVDGQVLEAIRDAQATQYATRAEDIAVRPRIGRVEEVRPDGSRICHVSYTYAPEPDATDAVSAAPAANTPAQDAFAALPRRYNLVTQSNLLGHQRSYAYQHHLLLRYTTYGGFAHGLVWASLARLRARWARSPLSDAQLDERHPITLATSYQARAIRTTTADGNGEVHIDYVRDGTTLVTEADGGMLEYTFNDQWLALNVRRIPSDGPGQSLGRRQWSRDGELLAEIDAQGNTSRYTYDAAGNLTSITDAKRRTTHITYNRQNLPIAVTDALGHTTQRSFDAAGRIIDSVDALGRTTRYQYDAAGRLATLTDALGGAKQLSYDNAGRLVAYTDCSSFTDRYAYDDHGRVRQATNALGLSSHYEYDALGRVTRVTHPDHTSETYGYDADDNLVSHTDANGRTTRYRYNGHGLPMERIDAKGQSLHYHYDRALRLVKLVNGNDETYRFSYDAESRLTSETGFDGKTTTYTYDNADQLTASECNGQRTVYRRDALGLLQTKTTANSVTRYAYDAVDRLTAVASPDARQYFIYDAVGQLLEERVAYALGGEPGATPHPTSRYTGFKLTHSYDALGNRLQTTLPNGRTIDTQRYGSGHWHGSLWQGSPLVDIERDHLHRETRRQISGARRRGATPQSQTAPLVTTRSYDPQSRLSAIVLNKGTQRLRQRRYQYDAGGNVSGISDSHRGATHYRYDPLGQLLSAVQPHLSETFAFDPAGNLLDGATHTAAADVPAFGGLARRDNADHIDHLTEQPRPSTRLPLPKVIHNLLKQYLEHSYEYDIQGNTVVKRLNANLSSQNQAAELALAYDADNRLVQATRTWAIPGGSAQLKAHYRYDAFGRRIAKQVTEHGTTTTTLFVWDGDVLVQEINSASTVTYLYEPESFVPLARIESAEGLASYGYAAQALHLPHEGQWELPRARDTQDAHVAAYRVHQEQVKEQRHQQAWQQRLQQAQRAAANDRIHHYQCDHLGTPLELMDETGKVVWAARYKAWGRVLRYDTRDVEQPLRFQGQYEDAETGLFYNRHRYYDPDQARYITQDPIGLAGGANLYAYAPNATAWVDPLGLDKKCPSNPSCDPCEGKNPAAWARQWQGHGDYKGRDTWTNAVLKAGTKIYGGAPGQSGFYFDAATLSAAGGNRAKLWQSLQVLENPKYGYRRAVQEYRVQKDTCVAISTANAQTSTPTRNFGAGGGTQYFLSDFKTKLQPIGSRIPLR